MYDENKPNIKFLLRDTCSRDVIFQKLEGIDPDNSFPPIFERVQIN